ncbi:MAG: transcription-repair coupling factor [Wenzhouxiangellaceae bacterium]|nr:transcription-repair coupling factor [Wenzhouxiangellaceae bacterium]
MSESFSVLAPPRSGPGDGRQWPALDGLGLALAVHGFARRAGGPVVFVAPDGYGARRLRDDINHLDGPRERPAAELFPDLEILPYDLYSPHPDLVSRRIEVLTGLPQRREGVIIAPVNAIMQRLAPPAFLAGRSVDFTLGETLDLAAFRTRLADAGYDPGDQVWQPGQFALRGSVFDLWPMGCETPYRIELFDDEIESIRSFDPETQRSIEKLDRVALLPGREYPFDETARAEFRRRFRNRFDVNLRDATVYRDVGEGTHSQGLEQYLPLFFDETAGLLDYLPAAHRLVLHHDAGQAAAEFAEQVRQRFEQRAGDRQRPPLAPEELYFDPDELIARLKRDAAVRITRHPPARATLAEPEPLDLDHDPDRAGESLASIDGRVLLAADTAGRRELIANNLARVGVRPRLLESWSAFASGDDELALAVLPFSAGARLDEAGITVLTESELFPGHARTRRRDRKSGQDPESIVRSLADLQPGALVVHLEHGIGRYLGLEVLDVGDTRGEFLTLEYADGDKLYVPVADLHLVTRYTGAEPEAVTLNRLGSDRWKKTRRKAAEKVRDVAAELLNVQARRAAREGTSCAIDRGMYARFAAGFEFEETDDQQDAIDAVLADLAAPRPMDRVVCGDVGFGKTEVALRAAFVVTDNGRQVALLAPTTLLAEQHYRTFADRFADWPVNVALLSRTGGKRETDATLAGLADGTIDIVIGTHRLLQSDVRFRDLGLVVVDEEQRFGVRQKEQLKKLRAEVDLLTLTATPIPRTLNMSMTGLRELSIIATPPERRMAIKTFVSEWDSATIRDAVSREFQRGGQVYFLHNDVRTQPRIADDLAGMFPRARIGIANGQMPPGEMERTMRDFYARRINLLVASTIIENGIDVPTANTIVINRADKFGLAQLHQLRGRVGRSHHLAYAYLITPPWKAITRDARKRLEAIQSLQELGAGFTLATHDLEIRGAGELLGEDQSGQIEAIGFQLYSDLLNRTVEALKAGVEPDFDEPVDLASEVDLHATAMIPDDYLPDVHQRLVLYKRIAQARSEKALGELQVEMIDRFGLLPEPVRNLFTAAELRLKARALGIRKLEVGPAGGRVQFLPRPDIDMAELIRMIQKEAHTFTLPAQDRLRIHGEFESLDDRVGTAEDLLRRLTPGDRAVAGQPAAVNSPA